MWADNDRNPSFFLGITGSDFAGDYLTLNREKSAFIVNLRHVCEVAIHPSVP